MSDEPKRFPIVDEPAPACQVPIVLSLPHSGLLVPAEETNFYAASIPNVVRYGDLYVDLLYSEAVALGITVVRTPYSRFLVDLNRLPDDLSPASVKGAVVKTEPGYHGARGVIWSVTPLGTTMYQRPLTPAHVQRRLDAWYHPYHAALNAKLCALRDRFGYAILIDGHSMPSSGIAARALVRPDIVPGDLLGTSCAPELTNFVVDYWTQRGRSVQVNRPYRGGAITRTHGAPDAGIHAIQIEINRALYMNEKTLRLNRTFARTREDCEHFLRSLISLNLAAPNTDRS